MSGWFGKVAGAFARIRAAEWQAIAGVLAVWYWLAEKMTIADAAGAVGVFLLADYFLDKLRAAGGAK